MLPFRDAIESGKCHIWLVSLLVLRIQKCHIFVRIHLTASFTPWVLFNITINTKYSVNLLKCL